MAELMTNTGELSAKYFVDALISEYQEVVDFKVESLEEAEVNLRSLLQALIQECQSRLDGDLGLDSAYDVENELPVRYAVITLDLDHRLDAAGIRYIEEVLALSRDEFLALPGMDEDDFLSLACGIAMRKDKFDCRYACQAWLDKNAPEIKLGGF